MSENSFEEELSQAALEGLDANSFESSIQKHEIPTSLSEIAKLKLEAIEDLMVPCDYDVPGKLDRGIR